MGVERFSFIIIFITIIINIMIIVINNNIIIIMKVEWPEFAACLAEMMKGEEEETAYRECFRWIVFVFVFVFVPVFVFFFCILNREWGGDGDRVHCMRSPYPPAVQGVL